MELQLWYLVVVAAVAAVIVWGLVAARQTALIVLAAALLLLSAFLLYTLVLEEPFIESDRNAQLDAAAMIGIPALLGIGLGALAAKRARKVRPVVTK